MSVPLLPPLASPALVAPLLGEARLAIIDLRANEEADPRASFLAGHLPGARQSEYARAGWRVKENGAPGKLPSEAALAALLGGLGLLRDGHVLIVSAGLAANDLAAAARVYWTLKVAGQAGMSILEGGFAAWSADPARPIETGPARPVAPTTFPVKIDARWRAQIADIAHILASGGACLVDARSRSYFEGNEKASEARAPGRIPGARSCDYSQAFDAAAGRLRDRAALAALFAPFGEGPFISYCNTGHTAALNWFVLSEVLGRADIRLYDGSMTEWSQDPARPLATGPA